MLPRIQRNDKIEYAIDNCVTKLLGVLNMSSWIKNISEGTILEGIMERLLIFIGMKSAFQCNLLVAIFKFP